MQKFVFDGENKLFIVKSGITEVDVKIDLYSDWKEELFLSDNLKWLQALSIVGGEPVSPTEKIGTTVFLINGWKVRPPEENTTIIFSNGNLYTDDQSDPFVSTLGNYNSNIIHERSNLRDEVDITSSDEFVAKLRETTFLADGETGSGTRFDDIMLYLLAMSNGKIVETSEGVYVFYAQDDSTEIFTLTKSGDTRSRSYP
jgi:hypothetical protein